MKKKRLQKTLGIVLTAALVLGSSVVPFADTEVPTGEEGVVTGNIQAEFFVSPNGNDENPGTYEAPFATVDAAREAVAKINGNMTGDIYVFILPGTYYVPETVDFGTADSATNGYSIYYKCLGEEGSAQLSGGIRVASDWELVDACSDVNDADSDLQQSLVGKVYKTNLKAQMDETFGEENWPATSGALPNDPDGKFTVNTITVNDTRATLARTLNSDKFDGMPATLFDNPLYTAGGNYVYMNWKSGDTGYLHVDQLVNAQNRGDLSAQIVCNDIGGYRAWDSDTLPITDVDAANCKLTFNPNDVGDFTPLYGIGGNSRYYLQGNLAFLDTPGEFYYNPATCDLYYYPKDGEENLEEQEIIVPTTDQVVRVEGEREGIWDDTQITPVENLVFDGLKFCDTSFPDYYSSGYPWLPYASGSPSKYAFPEWSKQSSNPIYCGSDERPQFQVGTVTLEYADHITLKNCHVKNAAMNGIEIYLGVTNSVVDNCLVEYCGNGGIMIEGGFPAVDGNSDAVSYTNNNTVKNTVVHDVGQMVHQTFGIEIANATYNTVTNCEIYHSPRRGILLMGSDVGSWNNTASGSRNWSSVPYDVKRDEYAHGNTFSNIYLHDVQQDGGDDGGLFAVFVYYTSQNFSRPNYYDQIVINEVGAQPNMGDIAPNNINLDMGWCGIEMSNIKTVNAQHYTIENSHLQDGQVKVDNCTFDFKNENDGLAEFDDFKMDYANIGVQSWQYPEAYQHAVTDTTTERPDDVYFGEDFENGIDLTKWSYSGNMPETSTAYMSEGPFNGKAALDLNNTLSSEKPVLYREFAEMLNKTVTVKIFDRQLSPGCNYSGEGRTLPDTGRTLVRADDGTEENIVSMGIDPSVNGNYYVVNLGGTKTATEVRRVFGWHELTFDYSEAGTVTLSIDGTAVGTAERDGFDYVALGSADGTGENFYDQLYIYGGADAAPWEKLGDEKTEEPETPSEGDTGEAPAFDVVWDFEDGNLPFDRVSGGSTYSGSVTENTWVDYWVNCSVADNPLKNDDNPSEKVFARAGQGGCHGYAQQNPQWSNYVWEFDYLFKDANASTLDNSVNFIIYSQNQNGQLASNWPYQPSGYWFNINEGKSCLELRKVTNQKPNNGTDLTKIAFDTEEFNSEFKATDQWHHVKIYALNGDGCTTFKVSVDYDKYVLEYTDASSPFTGGTIGINVMNTNFYLDNMTFASIAESPLKGYDANFKLGNAVLDQTFKSSVTNYTAEIADTTQDVTFVKPDGADAEYAVVLNDVDITDSFADTETPVALPLKAGNNTLKVTETTAQGIVTTYKVAMYKSCTLVSTDIPETMNVNVGTMPQLPTTTVAVINDGQKNEELETSVIWSMVDQSAYKTPGSFILTGRLPEVKGGEVTVRVNVDGLTSVSEPEKVSGEAGVNPAPLLAQTVDFTYAQSGTQQKDVTFKTFETSVYANAGTIVAVGSADGYGRDILQMIELTGSVQADKSALQKAYDDAAKIDTDKLTDASRADLEKALADAKAVLDQEDAAQEDIDAACDSLLDVVASLEEKEEPADQASKDLLQKTYDYALTLSTENVVDSAVKAFEKAKANAKNVLDDPNATQEEVNTAWDNLLNGIWGLGLYKGDKTNLELLIAKAQSMMENQDKYVTANWQQLVDALAEAEKVDADGDAMDEDIIPAADDLLTAILVQRYKANKTNLQSLITAAGAVDTANYTEASVAVFRAALASAQAVLDDDTLSTDDQKTVDDAVKALSDAIDALEETGDPDNTDDADNKDDQNNTGDTDNKDDQNNTGDKDNTGDSANTGNGGNTGSDNSNTGSSSTGSTSGTADTSSPKTGDSSSVMIWLVLALTAGAILAAAGKKRRAS